MAFFVNQKVVCINDSPLDDDRVSHDMAGLKKGDVYTVREIGSPPALHPHSGLPTLKLVEIARPPSPISGVEIGFFAGRFRPVKTTDISIFKAMLVSPPKEVVDA